MYMYINNQQHQLAIHMADMAQRLLLFQRRMCQAAAANLRIPMWPLASPSWRIATRCQAGTRRLVCDFGKRVRSGNGQCFC